MGLYYCPEVVDIRPEIDILIILRNIVVKVGTFSGIPVCRNLAELNRN